MTPAEYDDYRERVGEWFDRHHLAHVTPISDGEGNIEPYFSWRRCIVCGAIAGDRYNIAGVDMSTGDVREFSCVCTDCVYFAEYGRLDDRQMEKLRILGWKEPAFREPELPATPRPGRRLQL